MNKIGLFKICIIILILFLSSTFNFTSGQPRSGDWNVPTEFGEFTFTVNSEGTYINKISTTFSDYSCGGITQNGTVTSQTNPGWPISNNQFSFIQTIGPSGNVKMTYSGTFNEIGSGASGEWSCNVNGTICSGNWDYFSKTEVPSGEVYGIWDYAGSPYLVQGDITVPNDSTLTIEAGVLVEFQGHYKLNVQGRLLAVGTETDTIVFTINDTTGFYIPNTPDGGWFGIRFENTPSTNDSSKIVYCKLQYGKAIGSWPENCGGAIWVLHFDKLQISNCLITNNFSSGIDWPGGGGIALNGSNPKIIGNTISHNSAVSGGGIECYESWPLIENNLIFNNSATSGGGIVCNENSNPTITNTIIENNHAADGGGGIICWNSSSPSLENVTISNNSAIWGGGIGTVNSNLQIDNCTFIDNKALVASGGAINCQYNTNIAYQLNIKNTVFTRNSAIWRAGGLNVRADDSVSINIIVDGCIFENNAADYHTGLSFRNCVFSLSNSIFTGNTAVRNTAAAGLARGSLGTVSNCLFTSNVANTSEGNWNGGGVTVWNEANVDFMNCTFTDNSAAYGAGLSVGGGGTATTSNCIFWGNSTDQIALDTLYGEGGTLTVNYCDVQGGEDFVNVTDSLSTLIWGEGNIDYDPMFSDTLFNLSDSSYCVGNGIVSIEINGILYSSPTNDFYGNERPNPIDAKVDIGAVESPYEWNPIISVKGISSELPAEFSLSQNYPNPFNPSTTLKYEIPKKSYITLKVYDILGREVATLVNKQQKAGYYEVEWNAANNSSGVYFYKIQAGDFVETKKMILMK